MKKLAILSTVLLATLFAACGGSSTETQNKIDELRSVVEKIDTAALVEPVYLFGIDSNLYSVKQDSIGKRPLGTILNSYGISARKINQLEKKADSIFPLNKIRADKMYTAFTHTEQGEDGPRRVLDYMVYHSSKEDYITFAFVGDSVDVRRERLPIELKRRTVTAEITSSLWGAIMAQDLPYALADEFEDLFQWSVDFFSIQEGDSFTIVFDEKYADGKSIGIGKIYGARFKKGKKEFYAIPYADANGKLAYWDYDGTSIKKQMLQAPLKYTRISSKFTYKRLHPVHRVYRPHLGVDYAAPSGTPVHSVADGVVTKAGWGGGGGNTIKIKHSGGLETGYLHLKGFAKGIKVGAHVNQGQLIGYVGSTGTSTGPHLDYRIWQNGKPVDPLQVTQQPTDPISKKHRAGFENLRDRIIAEMDGKAEEGDIVTEDDIYRREKKSEPKKESTETKSEEKPAEKKTAKK